MLRVCRAPRRLQPFRFYHRPKESGPVDGASPTTSDFRGAREPLDTPGHPACSGYRTSSYAPQERLLGSAVSRRYLGQPIPGAVQPFLRNSNVVPGNHPRRDPGRKNTPVTSPGSTHATATARAYAHRLLSWLLYPVV